MIWKHFYTDVEKILEPQFLPCHVQNLVLITLLVNTGQFSERDIERKQIITVFGTAHQHVIVSMSNKSYKLDPFFEIFEQKDL